MSDLLLARLAAVVYEPRARMAARAPALGARLLDWADRGGTQAALFATPGGRALVFRGTQVLSGGALGERLSDIAANLRLCAVPWAGPGRVHRGYLGALGRVRQPARRMVREARGPVTVTGHSMGGALATLFAALAAAEGRADGLSLVTFGAPRAGNASALASLADRAMPVRRFVVRGDPATLWPPLGPFAHPGPGMALDPPGLLSRRHGVSIYLRALGAADGTPVTPPGTDAARAPRERPDG